MTIKKLTKWDHFVRKCSYRINRLGQKIHNKWIMRLSGKMLDYILTRHGCPKNKNCWLHKDYIEF